jgi:BMFP domain-containing protein YqiC
MHRKSAFMPDKTDKFAQFGNKNVFDLFLNQRKTMEPNQFFSDMQSKVQQVLDSSPAKDIEKNVKAMMSQGFAKLDLVTREEFDIQAQVLAKTRAKLEALEARIAELEAQSNKP